MYYVYWNVNRTEIAAFFCENKDNTSLQCFARCHLDKVIQKETSNDQLPVMPAQTYQFSVYTPVSFHEWCIHFSDLPVKKTWIPYSDNDFPRTVTSVSTPPPEWS